MGKRGAEKLQNAAGAKFLILYEYYMRKMVFLLIVRRRFLQNMQIMNLWYEDTTKEQLTHYLKCNCVRNDKRQSFLEMFCIQ